MTTSTITKIKNGAVVLPKKVQKSWKEAEIYVRVSDDTAIIKKVYKPGKLFDDETVKKLRAVGKKITKRDIAEAIKWARTKTS